MPLSMVRDTYSLGDLPKAKYQKPTSKYKKIQSGHKFVTENKYKFYLEVTVQGHRSQSMVCNASFYVIYQNAKYQKPTVHQKTKKFGHEFLMKMDKVITVWQPPLFVGH